MDFEDIPELPPRIFAAVQEPNGQRVNSYVKPGRIRSILNALTVAEANKIRESSFGKLLATADKPTFSGAFGQFLITLMIYVKKKHEMWFLFAGYPIRVSLREFAIVTGLPCGKYPKVNKKKKRNLVKDQNYFGALFGCLDPRTLTVDKVIKLLKKRIVRDTDRRIKYAYLALTASVLCPTSHFPKIIDEHVELIRDLDNFLAYPWSCVSIEMVVGCIKSKDEVALAQRSVAVQGFFHAIQLVLVEAVPALLEVVEVGASSSSSNDDSDMEDETRNQFVSSLGEHSGEPEGESNTSHLPANISMATIHKVTLSPGHARDVDEKCKASVTCIIPGDPLTMALDDDLFYWSDEEEDPKVDNMVRLIAEGFSFEKKFFKGGVTAVDLQRLRNAKKLEKEKKDKDKNTQHPVAVDSIDAIQMSEIVAERVRLEMSDVDAKVSSCLQEIEKVGSAVKASDERFVLAINQAKDSLIEAITKIVERPPNSPTSVSLTRHQPNDCTGGDKSGMLERRSDGGVVLHRETNPDEVLGNVLRELRKSLHEDNNEKDNTGSPAANFGIGVNLETGQASVNNVIEPVEQQANDNADNSRANEAELTGACAGAELPQRKSKRLKTQSRVLQGFQCTNIGAQRMASFPLISGTSPDVDYELKYTRLVKKLKVNRLINLNNGSQVSGKDVLEIAERTKVMTPKVVDALTHFSRILFMRAVPGSDSFRYRFLDTKLIASFLKHCPKFTKLSPKDRVRFGFQPSLLECIRPFFEVNPTPERFYFPFLVDKSHWVGVCVDIHASSIQVLDCNTDLRSDNPMKKDLEPVALMLPYLIKAVTVDPSAIAVGSFSLARARGVPHNPVAADSAVTTMLLLGSHSMVGFDGCKCITPEVLPFESKRLAVVFYEEYGGLL